MRPLQITVTTRKLTFSSTFLRKNATVTRQLTSQDMYRFSEVSCEKIAVILWDLFCYVCYEYFCRSHNLLQLCCQHVFQRKAEYSCMYVDMHINSLTVVWRILTITFQRLFRCQVSAFPQIFIHPLWPYEKLSWLVNLPPLTNPSQK